jgi:hypothetical protein
LWKDKKKFQARSLTSFWPYNEVAKFSAAYERRLQRIRIPTEIPFESKITQVVVLYITGEAPYSIVTQLTGDFCLFEWRGIKSWNQKLRISKATTSLVDVNIEQWNVADRLSTGRIFLIPKENKAKM